MMMRGACHHATLVRASHESILRIVCGARVELVVPIVATEISVSSFPNPIPPLRRSLHYRQPALGLTPSSILTTF
jgi:hypothetical protein